jgi:hypothetical protein
VTWPRVPAHEEWSGTLGTLHMLSQAVGKVRGACAAPVNHWWQSTLYPTIRGLTTSPMPHGGRMFEIEIDLVGHRIVVADGDGRAEAVALGPRPVADHYRDLMGTLEGMGLGVAIDTTPNEVAEAIPFDEDEVHRDYEPRHAEALRAALLQAHRALSEWRGPFVGKASPVHFFWGAFDLAVTRFSGRRAPRHGGGVPNCPDWVQEEAYSHEVSSVGWWPLGEQGPIFYAYMYPDPAGYADAAVRPDAARFDPGLGEFVLRWDDVLASPDPDAAVLDFCRSTYEAGADLAGWDRAALEPARYPRERPPRLPWSTTAGDRS